MNPYVADPHWRDYIVWYFVFGGIAAGSFATAALATLFGTEADRRGTRAADYLALPLVVVCAVLLVVDLGRPERFWHMLFASETWRPLFKWWSPMSVGSWGLSLFGGCATAAFAAVACEDGWVGSARLRERVVAWRRGRQGRGLALIGVGSSFFLGSYTGVLLAVTNQPVWSDSTWLGALFLASAASTGIAAILLVTRARLRDVPHDVLARIERLELVAIGLESLMILGFVGSLGPMARPALLSWPGLMLPIVVVPLGIVLPLALRLIQRRWADWVAPILVLLAGVALRAAIVGLPDVFRIES